MRNVGMYRIQRFDSTTTGLHWQIHKDAAATGGAGEPEGDRGRPRRSPGRLLRPSAPPPRIDEMILPAS